MKSKKKPLEAWMQILGQRGEDLGCTPVRLEKGKWIPLDGPYGLADYCDNNGIGHQIDSIEDALLSRLKPIIGATATAAKFRAVIWDKPPCGDDIPEEAGLEKALQTIITALEFYPHWKETMPQRLIELGTKALRNARK